MIPRFFILFFFFFFFFFSTTAWFLLLTWISLQLPICIFCWNCEQHHLCLKIAYSVWPLRQIFVCFIYRASLHEWGVVVFSVFHLECFITCVSVAMVTSTKQIWVSSLHAYMHRMIYLHVRSAFVVNDPASAFCFICILFHTAQNSFKCVNIRCQFFCDVLDGTMQRLWCGQSPSQVVFLSFILNANDHLLISGKPLPPLKSISCHLQPLHSFRNEHAAI